MDRDEMREAERDFGSRERERENRETDRQTDRQTVCHIPSTWYVPVLVKADFFSCIWYDDHAKSSGWRLLESAIPCGLTACPQS